jgi:membrane fusion protein, multidrug efflux system
MRLAVRFLAPVALAFAGACNKAQPAGAGRSAGQAFPVEVVTARADTVVEAIRATGQVEALQSIELRPEVDGRIVEILFREGQEIARGAGLFKVDDAELKAQVARAEAERDLAVQNLDRNRQLLEGGASSQAEFQQAEASARSAQAALDLLKIRLERTVVRAPFGGVVGQRLVSLGDYVNSQTRLLTLQTANPQRATFAIPERYAQDVRTGQRVTFGVSALRGRTFTGVVDFVDPVVQLPARMILVKATVPNPRRELQPGMFIEVELTTDVRPHAVVIPEDAVLALQGATFAWVVADGKATRRAVALGVRTPGFVEVTSGVAAGEQVVVGGLERLVEGVAVSARVVERGPEVGRGDR